MSLMLYFIFHFINYLKVYLMNNQKQSASKSSFLGSYDEPITVQRLWAEYNRLNDLTAVQLGLTIDEFIQFRSDLEQLRVMLSELNEADFSVDEFIAGFEQGRSQALIERHNLDFPTN
jgi:hypothetical protein